ncbi:MAG TPA: hypothetical protein PKC28_07150, partial [Bdellovibrionales bacterium]|nr:hypothetical protein [Bdellovibrionales bacterium]
MKSRIWVTTIAVGFISASAYAAFTETGNTTSTSSTWTQVTTVKTTVDRWMSYWSPKSETVVAPAAPVVVSAPESQPAGDTNTVDRARIEGTAPESVPVAEIAPAAEVSALKSQSLYESKATGSSLAEVRAARDGVRATQAFAVAKAGRAGTSKLGRDKSGVPVVDWKKLKAAKSIPRLDIGWESLISKSDFKVEKLSWGLSKPSDLKRLPGPAPIDPKITAKALAQPFAKAMGAKGLLANMRTVGQPISKEMVDKVQYNMVQVPDYQPLAYKPLSEEHMKMVAALILFEKGGSCHMIMGLFNQLATAEKTQAEATYHLGACADQLAMHQAAFDKLSELVVAEDDEFGKDALKLLAKDLPVIYEDDFAKIMKGLKNPKALISEESRDDVAYRFAKGAYRNGDFKLSGAQAELVSDKSPNKEDARFLSAMNSFALNDKPAALKKLQDLWASLEARKASNSNIRALTAVNLARMNFALKKYDKALEYYMQVPKDHALWVNALIEQGWTQLALEDFSGAIGNMYSLHSPYFKAVYQPESFVIRTIGYLNICQYGD